MGAVQQVLISIRGALLSVSLKLFLDAGNVSSYPGTGSLWTDLTTNHNNATLNGGITFDPSNLGSLVFDGVTGYTNTANHVSLNPGSNDFFMYVWELETTLTADAGLVNKWSGANLEFFFGKIGGSLAFFWTTDGTATTIGSLMASFSPTINTWRFLAASKIGGTLTLYADGLPIQTGSIAPTIFPGTSQLAIGRNDNGGIFYFNGKISRVYFSNGAGFTDAQVLSEYTSSKVYYGY